MASNINCCVCESQFGMMDNPLICNHSSRSVLNKCSRLSATYAKRLTMKNRNLKYFCASFLKGLSELTDLKKLISFLCMEINIKKNYI